MTLTLTKVGSMGWVAHITGTDSKYGFRREFLSGTYAGEGNWSNSKKYIYTLNEGEIYEISQAGSRKHGERYFARIVGGEIQEMTAEEVLNSFTAD